MNKWILTLIFCVLTTFSWSQNVKFNSDLEGYWTGAYIKNGNSVQAFTVDIYKENDTLRSAFSIPDWAYYEPYINNVIVEGRVVKIKSFYGEMTLVKDSTFVEMVGDCNFAKVHIKKGLRPPRIQYEKIEKTFTINKIPIQVRITKPKGNGKFPTAIIVHGRGCGSMNDWAYRPEILTQYGMAVVTFNKRGHESTGFPCEKTTMDMHSADLARLTEKIAKLDFVKEVGYIGYSAGGWTSPKAANETKAKVAFIVSVVGPSTSVKQQQLDCCLYYLRDQLGLGDKAIKEAQQFTALEFERGNDKETYQQLMTLLDSAKVNGWRDVLEESDIPTSADKMDELWVRRNDYDPSTDLQAFKAPFLSILGGDDFVVPYRENVAKFEELFDAVGKTNYQVTVVPSANHGMEHGHKAIDLGYERSIKRWHTYFKYDRVAPGAMDEIIAFLREYDIIER